MLLPTVVAVEAVAAEVVDVAVDAKATTVAVAAAAEGVDSAEFEPRWAERKNTIV